jgi:Protein of unknown function (DUF2892)
MTQNVGSTDRLARVLLGIIFGVLWFLHIVTGISGIILLVLGCVFLITAVIGNCPLYKIFGFSTCPRRKKQ